MTIEAPELPYHVRLAIQQQAERERKANTPVGRLVTLVFAGVTMSGVVAATGFAIFAVFVSVIDPGGQSLGFWAARSSLMLVAMLATVGAFITAALLVKS